MKLILFIVRIVLSLRYKVRMKGQENLKHDGPILVLPNHVALVDPRILVSHLGKYLRVSPVASELYYNKPILKQIMDMFGTVPVGEMAAGADAGAVKKIFGKVVEALEKGNSILIYPSGQIYRQGYESIKGKQSAYNISNLMPENTKVVAIRTTGLWGSIWSKAWDNGETSFGAAYIKSIKYAFSNLLFFVPKREVNIEIEDITKEINLWKKKSLNEFNKNLEDYYNQNGEEKVNFIKHYFYYNDVVGKKEPELITGSEKELSKVQDHDISKIDEAVKENIKKKISEIKEISIKGVNDNSILILDLFFDSLDLAEIKSYVQANFEKSSNPPINDLKSVSDLYIMAVGESRNVEDLKPCEWKEFEPNGILRDKILEGNTILSLWKRNLKSAKGEDFLWDNILGAQSKRDYILKVYFISKRLKEIKGDYIGIMMPSVGGASLLILATFLAGKIPVMFNWTLSADGFNHCVKFSKVNSIISAGSFYDRVKNSFLEEHKSNGMFIFLEDLLKDGKITEKIGALAKSIFMPTPKLRGEDTAVILFTSGSESLPKAVALSHENLTQNLKGALEIFEIKNDDILLGFLPPFHSFGFTVNTIMPLITGLRVVYSPDPNDAKTILEIIKHTKITAVTATPTFLKMILNLATGDELAQLRYAVVGAEKCPDEVFKRFKELCPNGKILEGYGITECSPVVSINPIDGSKAGTVGKVISCLGSKIIDIDSGEEQKIGEQGMIYVKGKSIFGGYLDDKLETPFDEIDSEQYYKTGDLGFLDKDGFLTITGRLKRFIKIAGEMISLPYVEGILLEKYGSSDEVKIAIEALEQDGDTKIVLFSLGKIDLGEANSFLRERGVPNLVKISENILVEEIPLLGTGKTDYKILKKQISFS